MFRKRMEEKSIQTKKGRHIDEVDFDLRPNLKTDKTGKHDIKVK